MATMLTFPHIIFKWKKCGKSQVYCTFALWINSIGEEKFYNLQKQIFFFLHLAFFVCWNALIFMIKCYVRRVTTKTVIANFIKLVLLVFTGDWIICKIKRERIRVGGRREEREGKRVCSREKFKERVAIHICTKPCCCCCCCCYLRKGSSVWIQIS